jgi:UDP-N-acetylmuramate--alanine ligase
MIDIDRTDGVYFVGIGGIGMSAIARYFINSGIKVFGYDRSESSLTQALSAEGCRIIYDDNIELLPGMFRDLKRKEKVFVVFTPAIPAENKIISWFRENKYPLLKRSEILGKISESKETLAVSGTHGKTTVSTMLAHLLRQSGIDCSAFLGGISKNYGSNLLTGTSSLAVMEADEFDRSFHRLSPAMAIVTSVDADHLDIYGDHKTMIEAYNIFFRKIRKEGALVVNNRIKATIQIPPYVKAYTYGIDGKADFTATGIRRDGDHYTFDLKGPGISFRSLIFNFPGIINIENAVAASSVAILCGAREDGIRNGLATFSGVRRRFDIRINRPGIAYIDDYAHHPEEIRACITSVKEYFGGRRITGIFQPHLFTRTLDHADGFAEILDILDDVILLPIYPAREKPVEGVTSELIFEKMKLKNKRLLEKNDIPSKLDLENADVLLTIGAGDIDRLVEPIENELNRVRK